MSGERCPACGRIHIGSVAAELNCLRAAVRLLTVQIAERDRERARLERVAEGLRSETPLFAPSAPERR